MNTSKIEFSINLNGAKTKPISLPAHARLIDYLHEYEGLTGTKYACGTGVCKACTVSMKTSDGLYQSIPACSTSLDVCNGWEIITIEGIGTKESLHPIQEAFIKHDAFQCGYCTPGFVVESFSLLENIKNSGQVSSSIKQEVNDVLGSHLCRCTGYQRYSEAVVEVIKDQIPITFSDERSTKLKWELIQQLHEAAEIENALMLQYLVAAFSVKVPKYKSLVGFGHRTPGSTHTLLGVAIEEMMHLDTVNKLLVELGASPNLVRQDMPYEPQYYPFQFELTNLSKRRLAQFVYAESSANAISKNPELHNLLKELIPSSEIINRVGSLYQGIRDNLKLYWSAKKAKKFEYWDSKLSEIMEEGESDHFNFFVETILGKHVAFDGINNVWELEPTDPDYPVHYNLKSGTALDGRHNTFTDKNTLKVAKLSNYHYWLTMSLFELSYRSQCEYHMIARRHMAGPLLQLCWLLPNEFGVLPPFDKSTMEYNAGISHANQLDYISYLLEQVLELEFELKGVLPEHYVFSSKETLRDINNMKQKAT